jgi:hypothetical protein
MHCLIFILVRNPAEQHKMVTLKQSKPTDIEIRVQSCSIWEGLLASYPYKFSWYSVHSPVIL